MTLKQIFLRRFLTARAKLAAAQERYDTATDRYNALLTGEDSLSVKVAADAVAQAQANVTAAESKVTQAQAGIDQAQAESLDPHLFIQVAVGDPPRRLRQPQKGTDRPADHQVDGK